VIGAYATRCGHKDPIALQVAQEMADRMPHGFPAGYNSLGAMFKMVTEVLHKLPIALAHANNIAREVGNVIDCVQEDSLGPNTKGNRRNRRLINERM
jgi:hypothetical protein